MSVYRRLRDGATTVATDGALRNGMLAAAWLSDAGGWAMVRHEYHRRGAHGTGVTVAELLAVRLAIVHHRHTPLRVLTDSRDAMHQVRAWLAGDVGVIPDGWGVHRATLSAFAYGLARRRDLTIDWTRGHSGHPLNEGADALAALAVRMSRDNLTRDQLRTRADALADAFAAAHHHRTEEDQPCR